MSIDTTALAADLAFMVADLPDEIVMAMPDGRTLACVAGTARQAKRLADDGMLPEYDLEVFVQKSLLVDGAGNQQLLAPRQQFTLTRTGKRYRIDRLSDSADDVAVIINALQVTL